MNNLNFRSAQFPDIPQLVVLINKSYREQQDRSWTTELDWVEGQRITEFQLEAQLQLRNSTLLIAETSVSKLIACIGLTFENNQVEIGTFCTDPQVQNMRVGRSVLEYAEQYALKEDPHLTSALMYVLDVRSELIAYYERRGYMKTGNKQSYPVEANVGVPRVPIKLVEMKKDLR
ncbi:MULTISPECIES: GNAT family N-acetyltransferase [Acinetobacter]|jgi:N-acetylglutamate synthase-like GNAT family acetyltransferase|uniref:GNAT family N-acetyltransferase n=1 Tax=Acinetobacter pittii TaxID=48296 RepID=A0AAE9SCE7_ACIPI|nr:MULTISPECIES: GNAT family N-acetyltransferase [Acinetobacter calcoaceticus/baumannii complex]AZP29215.1 GNAT family N-acetyltransferase [Acinetobacter pittii]EXC29204.1 acetyltransferase family protein [Acinetobacter sp. 809848]EXE28774.1 acetyltransferase family protein [Acinetobacter sp. 907131]EXS14656.1 acetyltransferase family protein [Acinetobacter sp. 883425]MBK0411877.1 GNAT family N-acetyltransferase [Acinetobacter pittii]